MSLKKKIFIIKGKLKLVGLSKLLSKKAALGMLPDTG